MTIIEEPCTCTHNRNDHADESGECHRAGCECKGFHSIAAPTVIDDGPTTRISEAHAALMADNGRLVDTVLTLKDLILSFDERLRETERQNDRLRERVTGVELLQLRDGLQKGRPA